MSSSLAIVGGQIKSLSRRGKIELTRTGLKFTGDVSFDEWEELGIELGDVNRASRWAIGDWVLYGEGTFGEKCYAAAEATGLTPERVRNIASVCKRVTPSRRVEGLGITFHEKVAPLPPREQRRLLARVQREDLTVVELNEVVREEFPDLPRGSQSLLPRNEENEAMPTLPRSYVVPGHICRKLVEQAAPSENGKGICVVPRYLIEQLASVIAD